MKKIQDFSVLSWSKRELGYVMVVMLSILAISAWQLNLGEIKARDAQRKSDTELIARSLITYYQAQDIYPEAKNGMMVACGSGGEDVCEWGNSELKDIDGVVYLKNIPRDPWTEKGYMYVYTTSENRQSFKIYVALENKSDKDLKRDLTTMCGEKIQCMWYVEN